MAAALASLARIEFSSGELAPADSHIESALDLIDSARATITSRDLRTAYFASRHSYYDLAVDVLMALDKACARLKYKSSSRGMSQASDTMLKLRFRMALASRCSKD